MTPPAQLQRSTAPARTLRVLHVEDNPDDAELVVRELRRGGYDPLCQRVETPEDMSAALASQAWDVILSDHSLPAFSAPEAFALVRRLNLDVPFIIVSGTVGEEVAVSAMRSGVHDFLLKGQLARLGAAIERELRESTIRAERRRIQEQLVISERMASVGTLAAGVAHEINNPLSVVAGNLHVIREDLAELQGTLDEIPDAARSAARVPFERASNLAEQLQEAIRDAEEAADRVRVIVRDLRVFSRSDEDRREPVDVHRVLESSIRMARNELRHRAKIVRQFGEVPLVEGNEPRLGQVFLNLLVNAAQAIPEGNANGNAVTVTTSVQGDKVVVDVADTGSGIPPEVLPLIFDVFFTTKPIGIGTGLGLTICHRILTAVNGSIEVKSTQGVGTTFRVTLRRSRAGQTRENPVSPMAVASPGRKPTALVVEDELALGRVLERILAPHRVVAVARAREALARIEAGERFDLVLCDVMMPEMTGMDLYNHLLASHPEIARGMVFITGGAFTSTAREFLEKVPNRRLDKPVESDILRALVDEAAARSS